MAANDSEERRLCGLGYEFVCGTDESGCGSFCGDVYAAAVILPKNIDYPSLLPGLNDSKKKSEKQREYLYPKIKQNAIAWAVATASVEEIDRINIYWAKFLAVRRAIEKLNVIPDYVIMDGDKEIPDIFIPQHAIVKGDQKSISIAAASILAKVDRDRHMKELAKKMHPDFEVATNKGYYCKATIEALKKHGKTKWHRQKYVAKYLSESANDKGIL